MVMPCWRFDDFDSLLGICLETRLGSGHAGRCSLISEEFPRFGLSGAFAVGCHSEQSWDVWGPTWCSDSFQGGGGQSARLINHLGPGFAGYGVSSTLRLGRRASTIMADIDDLELLDDLSFINVGTKAAAAVVNAAQER